jgi:3-mercaptopyruvate sulfurtransferase SseA
MLNFLHNNGLSDDEKNTINLLYSQNDNMTASRLALLLLDIGFTNFRILNGGLYNYALLKGEIERYTVNLPKKL